MIYIHVNRNNKENLKLLKKIDNIISLKKVKCKIISNYKNNKFNNVELYSGSSDDELSKLLKKVEYIVVFNTNDIDKFKKYNKKVILVYDSDIKMERKVYEKLQVKSIYEFLLAAKNTKKCIIKKVLKICSLILLISSVTVLHIFVKDKNIVEVEKVITKEVYKPQSQNYVFLGDSITEYYNMNTYFKDFYAVNSGIAGDNVDNVYNNLNKRVYQYNPTKVFILIGTNDLSYRTEEYIANRIGDIVKGINENRKSTEIYVQSIYPVNNTKSEKVIDWMVGPRTNEKIKKTNEKIQEICKNEKCNYINMYDILLDENGNLNIDYTVDGLHISEKGYDVITKELKKYIE